MAAFTASFTTLEVVTMTIAELVTMILPGKKEVIKKEYHITINNCCDNQLDHDKLIRILREMEQLYPY